MKLRTIRTLTAILVIATGAAICAPQARAELSPDEQVIEQLKQAGSDLSKPHAIEFYLYFPSKAVASSMVGKVKKLGLTIVRVEKAATGNTWLLLSSARLVPTKAAIEKVTTDLTAIAKSGNGEYDGWEAEVTM